MTLATKRDLTFPLFGMLKLRAEQAARIASNRRFRLVRLEELLQMSSDWAARLDGQFDAIVALPRSGLIVGNVLASELKLPLTTPDLLMNGEMLQGDFPAAPCRLLIVDDSIHSGTQMRHVVDMMKTAFGRYSITTAALLPHEASQNKVDLWYRIVKHPRIFEWDLAHTKKVHSIAFDIDGVLCEDVPLELEEDELRYVDWLENCRPFLLPRYEVDYLISNRLEKYREPTEAWLKRHGVRYRHLLLWDLPGKQLRGTGAGYSANKIRHLMRARPTLFVESSFWQARKIWLCTGIPTLCTDTMSLLN